MKKTLLMVIVSLSLLLIVSSHSYSQDTTPYSSYNPPPTFTINDGAACTESQSVRLKHNVCTSIRPCMQPVTYKISENPNFIGPTTVSGQFKTDDPITYALSAGYGKKTIYFQMVGRIQSMSNKIDYLASCDDVTFKSMDVQILRLNQPFSFDISCSFSVTHVKNANSFEINVQAVAAGRQTPLAQKTFPYSQYQNGIRLTIPVPMVRRASSRWPEYSNITLVAKIQPRPGATNVFDYNPNNNVTQRKLQIVATKLEKLYHIDKCTGPEGSKGPVNLVNVNKGWVLGQSTLSLHDCGTAAGEEIKCDNNPLPGLGQRGIRWVKRPTTADGNINLYYWCEGLANKRENTTYYFRGNVKYDIVEIRIP